MAERRTRDRRRSAVRLEVVRTERPTPHMVRVVAGGEGFDAFADNGCTDQYVKLLFPQPGVSYPEPFDMATIRETLPAEQWPGVRTYTVPSRSPAAPR